MKAIIKPAKAIIKQATPYQQLHGALDSVLPSGRRPHLSQPLQQLPAWF